MESKSINRCSHGGTGLKTPSGNIVYEPYCEATATYKEYPTGAVPGHFNYLCTEHASRIIHGRLERISNA